MMEHLNFLKANCKNCYKCLRECPVKAIAIIDHQAKIQNDNCILCGNCVAVCHQNAKSVSSEKATILRLLETKKVYASVAPSFVSSFKTDFATMRKTLVSLGFTDAFETAIGAKVVTEKYEEYLIQEKPKNLITSCCPSVNRLICQYYPKAMKYLAPFDSPMVVHGKMIKAEHPDAIVVFIGPCISKKREAEESKVIDGVLTFEDVVEIFEEKQIVLEHTFDSELSESELEYEKIPASRYYPVSRGIIKSMAEKHEGYEYVAIDGVDRCKEVLENIENIENMFIEMSACEFACINGPCSLVPSGENIMSTEKVRKYAGRQQGINHSGCKLDITTAHKTYKVNKMIPSESKIREILGMLGKRGPEDELDCGVCGYPSCREKAVSIYNGFSEASMCLPYMRERAESISFDIIESSPNGIITVDYDMRITSINNSGKKLLNINGNAEGTMLIDYMNPSDFVIALANEQSMPWKTVKIEKTGKIVEMTIRYLKEQRLLYTLMRDITARVESQEIMSHMKQDTLSACDDVITKQMRVVQEIASLLGETAAETKVALLKLKDTIEKN
ncbi:MAG: [Fe-Fe] hydrogenase large subunit C-terminal domain-containing protein [Bacillota bacterium]